LLAGTYVYLWAVEDFRPSVRAAQQAHLKKEHRVSKSAEQLIVLERVAEWLDNVRHPFS